MDKLNFLSKYNSLDDFQLKSFDITNNFPGTLTAGLAELTEP